jgi:hypothetical protein
MLWLCHPDARQVSDLPSLVLFLFPVSDPSLAVAARADLKQCISLKPVDSSYSCFLPTERRQKT